VDKHEEERAIINLPVLGPNWNEMSTRRRPPAVHGPEDLSTGIQRDRKGEKAKDSKQRVPRPDKRDKIIESGFELPSANKRQQKKSRVSHPVQEFDETGGRTGRKQRKPERSKLAEKDKHTTPQPADMPEKKRVIKVDGAISIGELAHRMGVKASELIRTLLAQGVMATINQVLTLEQATMLASKFNYDIQNIAFIEEEVLKRDLSEEDPSFLVARPPVVTVMGHVDHGKTSLLDAIRETHVADQEAGGITQHIGASRVELPDKGTIVFLDTPGHEAFTAMRLRGAQSTDIVILVVAADDGVMPQTIEAINHAKAAEVPIIVAINKVDKAGADPMRVRYSLMQYNLLSEEFGGDVMMVEVSAHTKQGLNDLLESVLLQAEIMELKANPNKRARGVVVESRLEMGRGPVAILLIQEGTLRVGESIIAGVHHGKIRAMFDADNQVIQEAGPSMPVKILGLSGTPAPGEVFDCLEEEKMARQIASHRFEEQRRKEFAGPQQRARLDDLWGEQKKELNVILKTDVEGTLEALKQSLLKLENREIQLNISHAAVGGITENDINLASATNSIVFGFYVRADAKAQSMAESQGIEIRTYRVIYELLDDIRAVMERQLAPTLQEKPVGQAEIRKIFTIPKVGHVAGCYVTDGKITRGSLIRLYRSNIQIYEGKVATLRRFKNDVKEVSSGYECGIQIDGYQDIRENDMIEAYEIEEIASKLNLGT
jgi:translation initiation factor IF-2